MVILDATQDWRFAKNVSERDPDFVCTFLLLIQIWAYSPLCTGYNFYQSAFGDRATEGPILCWGTFANFGRIQCGESVRCG